MAYKRADTNSFAEYQVGEGFGAAVNGKNGMNAGDLNIASASRIARKNQNKLPAGLQGLAGYEAYPAHYAGFQEYDSGNLTLSQAGSLIKKESTRTPAGLQGMTGYEGLGDMQDDAFAGFGQALSMKQASEIARENKISDDVDEFDGYGGLGETPLESWHTFFHQATMSKTDTDLIRMLRKAVKAVPNDTPPAVKRGYYEHAMAMLKQRKNTNLRYLDIERAEIEANLGWLVNPNIPKTGGFDAMLNKVVGTVGANLGRGDKDDVKMQENMALGDKLKLELEKTGQLGTWDFVSKHSYLTLGLVGLTLGGLACWWKKRQATMLKAKRKKK